MSELLTLIDTTLFSLLGKSVNPPRRVLLLLSPEREYEFYRDLREHRGLHEPAFEFGPNGKRRPYQGMEIIVSRDVDDWEVVEVMEQQR